MNWEAIGAIGEILGALAVICTLVYLAVQIKQNSNMMKANIKEQRATATQIQIQRQIDLAPIMAKTISGEKLSPVELIQLKSLFRGVMRNFDSYFRQHVYGLFDDQEWKGIKKTIQITINAPTILEEWDAIRSEFPQDFQNFVETLK